MSKNKLTRMRSFIFATNPVDTVAVSPEFLKALIQCADSLRKLCKKRDKQSVEISRLVLQHLDSIE